MSCGVMRKCASGKKIFILMKIVFEDVKYNVCFLMLSILNI